MKRSLLACTALIAVAGMVALAPHAVAATLEELQAQNQQLLNENARLREALRSRQEHAGRHDPAQRGGAAALRSPASAAATQPVSAALRSPQASGWYAADMPLKAAPAAVALDDWSGPYAGVNVGWSVGASRASQSVAQPFLTQTTAAAVPISPNGIVDGAQIGWNWQGGRNWLAGVEADIQSSDEKDTTCTIQCTTFIRRGLVGAQTTVTAGQRLDWFGTARARIGFVQDRALFYVTGGAAFGRVHLGGSYDPGDGAIGADQGFTQLGWTAGGGVEAALGGRWTGKLEYLYLDLGNMTETNSAPNAFLPFTQTTTASFRDHIFRGGLNYRFGAEPAYASAGPVPTLYAGPAFQWTGFYVGGNAGLGIGTTRTSFTNANTSGPIPFSNVSNQDSVLNPFGAIGGAQAGFNWQAGRHWLVGVEGDVQASGLHDQGCAPESCFLESPLGGGVVNTISQKLDFFATARARAGYVDGSLLFYGTGGLAFGRVDETVAVTTLPPTFAPGSGAATTSTNRLGWTAGVGIEAALSEHVTGKVEYLHLDLGSVSNSFIFTQPPTTPIAYNFSSSVRDDVVRAGVNYRIGP